MNITNCHHWAKRYRLLNQTYNYRIMNLAELFKKERCSAEEQKQLLAYYLAMKIQDMLPIWYAMLKQSKLI